MLNFSIDSMLRDMRWPLLFWRGKSAWEPALGRREADHPSVGVGLGMIGGEKVKRKRSRQRPSAAVAHYFIGLRLRRKQMPSEPVLKAQRSPLISQEEYYREYLASKPSAHSTSRKKRRSRASKTRRARRDYQRCKGAWSKMSNDLLGVKACQCGAESSNNYLRTHCLIMDRVETLQNAKDDVISEITTGFGGNTILKRKYLEFPLKVCGMACLKCGKLLGNISLGVWRFSSSGYRSPPEPVEPCLATRFEFDDVDDGYDYDYETGTRSESHDVPFYGV